MKTFRMMTAFAVLVLLVALVPAAFAQDFGLSAEDSAALTAATAASAAATSGHFDFTLDLTAIAEGETVILNVAGAGDYGQDASGNPLFQLSVNGQADMGEDDQTPLQAELRFVNNSIYFMVPALMGPQWLSLSSDDMGSMTAGLPFDPSALASGDMSGLEGLEGMEGMGEMMAALAAMQPEQYISQVRNGDQFTTTVDLTGLIGSEGFQSFIRSSIEANADEMEASGMSEAEINQMVARLSDALPDSSFTLEQYVSNGMLSRTVVDANLNIDPAALGESGETINMALTFDISMSNYNQPVTVTAPADAVDLMEMMGAGMGASS